MLWRAENQVWRFKQEEEKQSVANKSKFSSG